MSARLTPMQVRQAAMRRNSVLTAMMAVAVAGGTYVYTMHAMSGRSLDDVDIDQYRSQPVRPNQTSASGLAVHDLGPLSATPSIAPGGNPMLEK